MISGGNCSFSLTERKRPWLARDRLFLRQAGVRGNEGIFVFGPVLVDLPRPGWSGGMPQSFFWINGVIASLLGYPENGSVWSSGSGGVFPSAARFVFWVRARLARLLAHARPASTD
jgi:hypothetical protein